MTDDKIMVVEDEKDLRDVYTLVLKHHGYEVCTAVNGQDALDKIEDCNPKLVLLDIFMPVMDGESFMRSLDLSKHPGMRVVVCSNTADQKLMDNMRQLGASDVITKSTLAPQDLADLVQPYLTA